MSRRVISGGRAVYTRSNYARPAPARPRLRSPRLSTRNWRSLVMLLVGVGAAVVVLNFFRLEQINVVGTARKDAVRTNTEHLIRQNIWWSNLLSLDTSKLAAKIEQEDPQLKQVSVRRRWPRGIAVQTSDKRPSLVWDTGGERYLIDADGTTITLANREGEGLPTVRDQSNLPTESGKVIVTSRFVSFVTTVVAALPLQGIKVSTIEVHETTLDLYLTTDKNYQIILDTSRAASDELNDLKLILKTLSAQKLTPSAYIDLRVPGKAYYK